MGAKRLIKQFTEFPDNTVQHLRLYLRLLALYKFFVDINIDYKLQPCLNIYYQALQLLLWFSDGSLTSINQTLYSNTSRTAVAHVLLGSVVTK